MSEKLFVIATDGSAASLKAVQVGLDIAAAQGAAVIFLHFSPLASELYAAHPEDGPSQEQIAQADPVLDGAREAARERGVPAELRIAAEHGAESIAASIVGIAEGLDAEMIVVGTRGHGELTSAVLGSVSHDLLRFAPLPVVVVNALAEIES